MSAQYPQSRYRNRQKIGPYSRPPKLALIDERRAEAQAMNDLRVELWAHCGGKPSAVQRQLIERAAVLYLRLLLWDRATAANPEQLEGTAKQYLAFSNSYARTLRLLGMKAVPEARQSLKEYLAAKEVAPVAPTPAEAMSRATRRTPEPDATQPALVRRNGLTGRGSPTPPRKPPGYQFKHSEAQRAKWRELRRLRKLRAEDAS